MTHIHLHKDVKRFHSQDLEELAFRLGSELGHLFRPFGANLVIQPISWTHLMEIGEGFEINLRPVNPDSWSHWGDFESCIEVFRRSRWTKDWRNLISIEDVERWARTEIETYYSMLGE